MSQAPEISECLNPSGDSENQNVRDECRGQYWNPWHEVSLGKTWEMKDENRRVERGPWGCVSLAAGNTEWGSRENRAVRCVQKCTHQNLWRKQNLGKALEVLSKLFLPPTLTNKETQPPIPKVAPMLTSQNLLSFFRGVLPGSLWACVREHVWCYAYMGSASICCKRWNETRGSVEHGGTNTDSKEEAHLLRQMQGTLVLF